MAIAVRPTAQMQSVAEVTAASAALSSEAEAVGAYDHVPFTSAAAVFTMDTASEVFVLHSAQVLSLLPSLTCHAVTIQSTAQATKSHNSDMYTSRYRSIAVTSISTGGTLPISSTKTMAYQCQLLYTFAHTQLSGTDASGMLASRVIQKRWKRFVVRIQL